MAKYPEKYGRDERGRDGARPRRGEEPQGGRRGPRDGERGDAAPVRGERRASRARPSFRLPAEEPPARFPGRGRGHTPEQSFTCGHCKRFVGLLPSGGRQRNHCPFCLYSRHVDERRPGDRASACKSLMAPIGAFQRPNGEHCIVHKCLGCDFERFNRIGADDDFELVLSLPVVPPRSARPGSEEAPGA
jgi:hypothetical protein